MADGATKTGGRKATKEWTAESLKALPWGERVRVVHGLFDGTEKPHEYLGFEEAFAMCIRRTWPKGREFPPMVQCAKSDGWHTLTGERDSIGQALATYDTGPLKCGTPNGVYRLAYLVEPRRVNFSDMYKCRLFKFFSPDRRTLCSVELFKYAFTLYFYCRKEDTFIPDEPELPEVLQAGPQTEEEAEHWHDFGTGGWARLVDSNPEAWRTYLKARQAHRWQGVIEPEWSTELVSCKSSAARAWMALVVKAANRRWRVYPGNNLTV